MDELQALQVMSETALLFFGVDCTERVFRAHFGQGLDVIANIWARFVALSLLGDGDLPEHLLWMFYWWKVYPTFDVAAKFVEVDPRTFRCAVLRMQTHCVMLGLVSNICRL